MRFANLFVATSFLSHHERTSVTSYPSRRQEPLLVVPAEGEGRADHADRSRLLHSEASPQLGLQRGNARQVGVERFG